MSNLVIVESPAKAKTIKKYLGKNYEVVASMGHVRDLPKSTLGVDVDNGFTPKYINIRKQSDTIKALKDAAKKCDKIYLATDPDREGEAISWHLANLLKLDVTAKNRITFNEITKTGVKEGMAHPRQIDMDLFDAQQARRILDRIVGYKLSPFLWKKVRPGLSAGRVQSVTVRIIVDRENEIRNFVPEEYWSIDAKLLAKSSKKAFGAKFYGKDGKKMELKTKEETDEVLSHIRDAAFTVSGIKTGIRKKSPAPPFTTSTMQQEASRKLGFQSRRTMKAAQELYEGVEVPKMGAVGLITYMRTDSLRISNDARRRCQRLYSGEVRRHLSAAGTSCLQDQKQCPGRPRGHPSHHAEPDPGAGEGPSLTGDQYKLYKLIWERFIASQMANAVYDTVSVDIDADGYTFKASGFTVKFDGFTVLYVEGKDEEEEKEGALPQLEKDDVLESPESGRQPALHPAACHGTPKLPSSRLWRKTASDAPSTYAPTITTILARGYIEREGKAVKAHPTGRNHHPIDERALLLHRGREIHRPDGRVISTWWKKERRPWVKTLEEFYGGFAKTLEDAEKNLEGTLYEGARRGDRHHL